MTGYRHLERRPPVPKAVWNGAVIAESDDTVVVEGNHWRGVTVEP